MKTKTALLLAPLIGMLLLIAGCLKEDPVDETCFTSDYICSHAFKPTYLRRFQDEKTFLIKGVALDNFLYGRNIKIIEDLKGNYKGKSSILVWGNCYTHKGVCVENCRLDDITQYNENDTLIIFMEKARKRFCKDIEKSGQYTTIAGSRSTLKFSNGYVTGPIDTMWDSEDKLFNQTIRWDEFQEECQAFLNSNEKPSWWFNNPCDPVAFCIAHKFSKFFIKGLVLEPQNQYGKKIQLITDFNGNFPEGTTPFTVWGDIASYDLGRFDDLRLYNNQDTLLMLIRQLNMGYSSFPDIDEKKGDFETFPLAFSVLKLSNNFVSGHITSCYGKEEIMSFDEFQALINLKKE